MLFTGCSVQFLLGYDYGVHDPFDHSPFGFHCTNYTLSPVACTVLYVHNIVYGFMRGQRKPELLPVWNYQNKIYNINFSAYNLKLKKNGDFRNQKQFSTKSILFYG